MRHGKCLAGGRWESQAQCGLGGRVGVAEPRERRRRAWQIAELLAGGQGQARLPAPEESVVRPFHWRQGGPRPLPAGGTNRLASFVGHSQVRRSSPPAAPGSAGCRCSRAARRCSSGARSGAGAGRSALRLSGAAPGRPPEHSADQGPDSVAADAAPGAPRGLPTRRAGAPGHRSARWREVERRDVARPRSGRPPGSRIRHRSARATVGVASQMARRAVRLRALEARGPGHSSQQREHRILVRLSGDENPSPGERL